LWASDARDPQVEQLHIAKGCVALLLASPMQFGHANFAIASRDEVRAVSPHGRVLPSGIDYRIPAEKQCRACHAMRTVLATSIRAGTGAT
jgi:hypothetical protein